MTGGISEIRKRVPSTANREGYMMENTTEQAAEMLLDVLLDCSIAKAPKVDRLVRLDLATFADVLDILIPALESHRDCARQGL